MRKELQALNHSLAEVHKFLLNFQKEVQENIGQARLTPYDVLHLSTNHPDFEWIRKLSEIMAEIDEAIDSDLDDNQLAEFSKGLIGELRALFEDPTKQEDFKNRLNIVLKRNPAFHLEIAKLKSHFF